MIESLKRNMGRTDFAAYVARIIASHLREDARYYLRYGPYWWPLQEVLQKEGLAYGRCTSRTIANAYRARPPKEPSFLPNSPTRRRGRCRSF